MGVIDWFGLVKKRDRWRTLKRKCDNVLSGSIKCGEFLE